MSSLSRLSGRFRFAAAALFAVAIVALLWSLSDDEPTSSVTVEAPPQTAALQRSYDAGPLEFDTQIKSASSGLCLDMFAFGMDNDSPVILWDCNDTLNQRIWADSVADTNYYRLRFEHSGKCLEPAGPASPGIEVRQWICHSGDYQRPSVDPASQHWSITDLGQGHYSIKSVNSGWALTTTGSQSGDVLQIKPWTGADNQRFKFESYQQQNTAPAEMGTWGKLIAWPHVPVHAAVTPDNHVVTWASNETDFYPQATANKFTWSSVYDPQSDTFLDTNNATHDMFCAGTTLLENGDLLASGGNPRASETSVFDSGSKSWALDAHMSQQRWYGTNVVTGSGDVFSTFAKGAQEIAELYTVADGGWQQLPGADMSVLRDEQDLVNAQRLNSSAEMQWYAFMHTAPDGRVFQSGPTKTMHWFDVEGQGGVESAGTRVGDNRNRQFGSAVMYDVGKLLISGGSDPTVTDVVSDHERQVKMGSADTAMSIDINGAVPVVQSVPAMNARRANHDAVVLANGEVYVVGGTEWGLLFDDHYTTWWPEIWNPKTREWRTVAALSTPRNYHSWAVLLQDGRVLTGGGGLCGDCAFNHPDAQIYSPPYLYNSSGALASRPVILAADTSAKVGGVLSFTTDRAVDEINLVRLSSVTHSVNTDQRFIPLNLQQMADNTYAATLSSNVNILIPGMYWAFALDDSGVPSEGHLLQLRATQAVAGEPLARVVPEGGLQLTAGQAMELKLPTDAFDQSQLVINVIGLPAGLSIDEELALISGATAELGDGSFIVSMSDGTVQTTERVAYTVNPVNGHVVSGGGGMGLVFLGVLTWVLSGFRRSTGVAPKARFKIA